jgi:hypothetical protein
LRRIHRLVECFAHVIRIAACVMKHTTQCHRAHSKLLRQLLHLFNTHDIHGASIERVMCGARRDKI